MRQQEGSSIFSSLKEFSHGEKMFFPYLWWEEGVLDPAPSLENLTSWEYCPVGGGLLGIWVSGMESKLKRGKIGSVQNKRDSTTPPVS